MHDTTPNKCAYIPRESCVNQIFMSFIRFSFCSEISDNLRIETSNTHVLIYIRKRLWVVITPHDRDVLRKIQFFCVNLRLYCVNLKLYCVNNFFAVLRGI
jgi:hypothetical protein